MSAWQPIETAPKDGSRFLACQDNEVYVARYIDGDRLAFRTHQLQAPTSHRIVKAELDGKTVEAQVLVEKGPETFEHRWTYWTRGFDFAPTGWLPAPPDA